MEHPIATPFQLAPRGDRRLTLILGAVAAAAALVILVAAIVLVAKPISKHLRDAAVSEGTAAFVGGDKTGPTTPGGKAKLARSHTTVVVLNGNGVAGAAAASAERLRKAGYRIGTVGNAALSDNRQSVVMYRRGYRAEGLRLGRDLRVKIVGPLDGIRARDVRGAQLVYIVR